MSDRELILKAQQGRMFAFEALVERHRDDVYAFGLRLTRSETDAAEIAQESFLSAYLHLSEFRNEAEFTAWVHWIAATHASLRLPLLRTAQSMEEQLEAPPLKARGALAHRPEVDWSKDADERPLTAELRRAVLDATDRLPPRDREIFLFKDVAGLTCEQVAKICGDSVPAIKFRLHQARLLLREAIDHFYSDRTMTAKLSPPANVIAD